jgi:hypothetical protein
VVELTAYKFYLVQICYRGCSIDILKTKALKCSCVPMTGQISNKYETRKDKVVHHVTQLDGQVQESRELSDRSCYTL